jgi:hypothetical protein
LLEGDAGRLAELRLRQLARGSSQAKAMTHKAVHRMDVSFLYQFLFSKTS